jgi:hypothetical protein
LNEDGVDGDTGGWDDSGWNEAEADAEKKDEKHEWGRDGVVYYGKYGAIYEGTGRELAVGKYREFYIKGSGTAHPVPVLEIAMKGAKDGVMDGENFEEKAEVKDGETAERKDGEEAKQNDGETSRRKQGGKGKGKKRGKRRSGGTSSTSGLKKGDSEG